MTTAPDFGSDLFNDGDLDPFGREVSGFEGLAQALLRRLDTPANTLPDDDDGDYGYDLSLLLSEGMTDDELAAVGPRVEYEFGQDERVHRSTVKASLFNRNEIRLNCFIVPRNGETPFTLVLAIGDVAKVLSITPVTA